MATKTKRRQYTDADRANAIGYAAAHSVQAAADKYKVAKSQIYQWRTMARTKDEAQRKGNGAAGGKTFEEGSGERMAHALRWLGQWKSAQIKAIRGGAEDTPYDIYAEHAFRVLKGEE